MPQSRAASIVHWLDFAGNQSMADFPAVRVQHSSKGAEAACIDHWLDFAGTPSSLAECAEVLLQYCPQGAASIVHWFDFAGTSTADCVSALVLCSPHGAASIAHWRDFDDDQWNLPGLQQQNLASPAAVEEAMSVVIQNWNFRHHRPEHDQCPTVRAASPGWGADCGRSFQGTVGKQAEHDDSVVAVGHSNVFESPKPAGCADHVGWCFLATQTKTTDPVVVVKAAAQNREDSAYRSDSPDRHVHNLGNPPLLLFRSSCSFPSHHPVSRL